MGCPPFLKQPKYPCIATIAGGTADLGRSQVIRRLLHSIRRCKGKDGSNRKQQLGLTGDGSEHTWAPAAVGFNHVLRCLAV